MAWHGMAWPCHAMQCNAMQYNAMQCNAMQCNAMQCNAMQCNAMQSQCITIIINQMLETGVFPDKLEVAKVISLFKEGDPTPLTYYRPISLLPSLSRYLKKLYTNNYMLILKTQTCSLKVNMASVKAIPLKWHL